MDLLLNLFLVVKNQCFWKKKHKKRIFLKKELKMNLLSILWDRIKEICSEQGFSNHEERRYFVKLAIVLRPCIVLDSCLEDRLSRDLYDLLSDPYVNIEHFCHVMRGVIRQFPIPNFTVQEGKNQLNRFALSDQDLKTLNTFLKIGNLDDATNFLKEVLIPKVEHSSLFYPTSTGRKSLYPESHAQTHPKNANFLPIEMTEQKTYQKTYGPVLALIFVLLVFFSYPSPTTHTTPAVHYHFQPMEENIETIPETPISINVDKTQHEELDIQQKLYEQELEAAKIESKIMTYDQWLSSIVQPNYFQMTMKCKEYHAQYLEFLAQKLHVNIPKRPETNLIEYVDKYKRPILAKLSSKQSTKHLTPEERELYNEIIRNINVRLNMDCEDDRKIWSAKTYTRYGR